MALVLTARERRALALLLVAIVGARLATLGAYPLMDSTESRYAEIARKMLETGDWLMPQFDYGVPFWGKPPLSTWFSAAALGVLGIGEFAARVPSFLLFLACSAIVAAHAALRAGRDAALWTLALFASTALVFIAAGAVMTDPALALGTTLSMTGFWIAVCGADRFRRAAAAGFFLGLAVGLLAKGPVAMVLTFLPVGAWALATRRWRDASRGLPWIAGLVATAALVAPWYWAAERASPGFLDYFLVGEHWKRFVETGWKGDLYGAAHARTRGMIWLYWIAAALPWSAVAIAWLVRAAGWRRDDLKSLVADPWRLYLLLWTIAPMVFFTVSGNILATYVLPGLPAFALLVGDVWRPQRGDQSATRPAVRSVLVAGFAIPLAFVAAIATQRDYFESTLSQKALVRTWEATRAGNEQSLIYAGRPPASADFYSRGRAKKATDAAALAPFFDDETADFIALRSGELARLPQATRSRLAPVGEFGDYRLLRETPH
jgi:4-amino-4-deoxy-L-arabinose transferase-like glycosyltransferase